MTRWPKVKLKDVAIVSSGNSAPQGDEFFINGKYPFCRTSDVGAVHLSPNLTEIKDKLNERGIKGLALFPKGTILIPKSGASTFLNHRAILGLDSYVSSHLATIQTNEIVLFNLWAYYFLVTIDAKMLSPDSDYPTLKLSTISNIEIPLPLIEEQKKIAARLDAVSELLEKQKQLLAEQDTLIQSLFYDTFGIPFKNDKNFKMLSIEDIVSDVQYGTSKKADTSGSTPILRMNNIKYSGEMDYSDLKFIDLGEETSKYLLKKGDILFNRTNSKELVGKTGLYNFDSPMVYAGYLIRVRLKDNFLPICFSVYMNTPYLKAFFLEKCKSIVGMANINAKELQKIPIYLPPLELQEKFAAIVEQIESEKSKIKSAIAETQALFNALMVEYFEE